MDTVQKTFALTTRSPAGMHDLEADIILSTEGEDRDGDVISAAGWRLDNFKKSPAVLLNHDTKGLPVARAENVRIVGDTLTARPPFPPAGISPRADEARQLLKADILTGCSVGFKPITSEPRKGGGTFFREQELIELSLVSVPANVGAVVVARAAGQKPECPRGLACQSSVQEGQDGRCPAAECPMFAGLPTKDIAEAIASMAPELAREAAEQVRAALTAMHTAPPVTRGRSMFERLSLATPTPSVQRLAKELGLTEQEVTGAMVEGLSELRRSGEMARIIDTEVKTALRSLSGRYA